MLVEIASAAQTPPNQLNPVTIMLVASLVTQYTCYLDAVIQEEMSLTKDYGGNLLLFIKLFLQHKAIYKIDQVFTFLFHALTKADTNAYHIIGYFYKVC
ncbi:hypothetical protein P879_02739 [Paragonimus westermani]|uniref:MYST-type HAT domain-containing protein n=1 Tax=Paragonimus westermani TaxID=34504 RepID=A0A8T0DUY4_9TREM|nr:hypothetical protein P879_02739 [Paragonimus westermani]